jgi:cellulose synthase/poly-beta-1,6-N-acetylglucosamine synthase-like glycosyltransferase
MIFFLLILGAIGISWIGYVYVGYPIAVWLIGLRCGFRADSREDFLPPISVLISARNEEKDIGRKIIETLSWNYPKDRIEIMIASDASDDKTDEIVRSVKDPRVKFLRLEERVGKNEALNRLAQIATGEFFFFTDANSHIPEACARKMIRNFADPRVGCVTGADRIIREEQKSAIGIGENSYWSYETKLQKLESRLGSVLICFGAIFCIRRSLFSRLQRDLANDLELPIRIGSAGYAILYETEAWAAEKPTRSPNEEFARRRRICAQGLLGLWRLRNCLHGLRAWQFISRKFLRWTVSIPLLMILFSSASMASHPVFRSILIVQILFYAAACVGWLFSILGRMENSAFALPFYFVLVNVAALVGLIDACAGRRYNVWEVASMTRGTETT